MESIISALQNIGFDWRVALANFVNFLIIFWLLKRFIFRPMQKTIDERNSAIHSGLKNAEEAKSKLKGAEEEYGRLLTEGKREVNEIVAKAKEQEALIIEEARKIAEKEALDIVLRSEKRMQEENKKMNEEFKRHSVELISLGVKKVARSTVTADVNEKMVGDLVK